jgi:hypothetical protein
MWLTWMIRRAQLAAAGAPERARLVDACIDVLWNTLYAFSASR